MFLAAQEFDRASELAQQVIQFLQGYGQTTVWVELAREVSEALPVNHDDKLRFIGTEGDGLALLGFTAEAMDRHTQASALAERLVAQEPDRADFLRNLSVSYNKMGDLQQALGQGDAARQFFQKSLDLRERLVAQEPGRADFLDDLATSYERVGEPQRALSLRERLVAQDPGQAYHRVRMVRTLMQIGNTGSLQRALEIVTELQNAKQLTPIEAPLVEAIRQMLQQVKSAGAS